MPTPDPTVIQAFLDQPLLARLATLNPAALQPHLTTVWYAWDGASLWFSGFRSTRKFRELLLHPRCAVLVDVEQTTHPIRAVLVEGAVELIDSPRALVEEKSAWIYLRYLGAQGVLEADPQSWIHDPENLVARLVPGKIYTWG